MTLQTQWMTMTLMLGSGLLLGFILDLYQVLKSRFRLRGWVISLVDLLYWTVSSFLVFSILMWSNWGELRLYIFLAICVGFFLYYRWFSHQSIRWIQFWVHLTEKTILWIFQVAYALIWIPIVFLWDFLGRVLLLIWRLLWLFGKWSLFAPLEWLSRPIRRASAPWINPVIQRTRNGYNKWLIWWKKDKDKDDIRNE